MGKPALVLETTLGRLDPVAAELILLAAGGQGHDRTVATGQMIVVVGAEVVVFVGDALGAALAQAGIARRYRSQGATAWVYVKAERSTTFAFLGAFGGGRTLRAS